MTNHELYFPIYEAPSLMFWRFLGATAQTLVRKNELASKLEDFDGLVLPTWHAFWQDDEANANLLKVRAAPNMPSPAPTSLLVLAYGETEGSYDYTRFIFEASADATSEQAKACVVRGHVTNEDDPSRVQTTDLMEGLRLGIVTPNHDDMTELHHRLSDAVLFDISNNNS